MDKRGSRGLSRTRLAVTVLALLLILLSWWRVLAARSGLTLERLEREGVPLQFIAPVGAEEAPGILIAHGFGVSQQIMQGYGYSLAQAGYGVMLLDFDGHGRNQAPFSREAGNLQRNLEVAYAELSGRQEIDSERIGLLGHSMGSGAVMSAGIGDVERYMATVAVSPTGAPVSAVAPRNLLLQAGAWESRFVTNAEDLLAAAGGENNDFEAGLARSMQVVPQAEHVLILFKAAAHDTAVAWFDQAFRFSSAAGYRDVRPIWYLLSIGGWALLAIAAAPLVSLPGRWEGGVLRPPWHWLGLALAPLAASVLLALLDQWRPVGQLGGMLVGGAVGLWFFIMGAAWLALGFRPSRASWRPLGLGLFLFAFLWLAIGLMANEVALNWLLVPDRLLRWPLMSVAFLPWLLAAGGVQSRASTAGRVGWWLAQTVSITAGLILAVALAPSLSVLLLILPILPGLFGMMAIAGAAVDHPWAYAIGNSLFLGWLMMAYFPFVGG